MSVFSWNFRRRDRKLYFDFLIFDKYHFLGYTSLLTKVLHPFSLPRPFPQLLLPPISFFSSVSFQKGQTFIYQVTVRLSTSSSIIGGQSSPVVGKVCKSRKWIQRQPLLPLLWAPWENQDTQLQYICIVPQWVLHSLLVILCKSPWAKVSWFGGISMVFLNIWHL